MLRWRRGRRRRWPMGRGTRRERTTCRRPACRCTHWRRRTARSRCPPGTGTTTPSRPRTRPPCRTTPASRDRRRRKEHLRPDTPMPLCPRPPQRCPRPPLRCPRPPPLRLLGRLQPRCQRQHSCPGRRPLQRSPDWSPVPVRRCRLRRPGQAPPMRSFSLQSRVFSVPARALGKLPRRTPFPAGAVYRRSTRIARPVAVTAAAHRGRRAHGTLSALARRSKMTRNPVSRPSRPR